MRLLSVDLGLRHAAACAVWEAVDGHQVRTLLNAHGLLAGQADGLYLHLRQGGRTVVYRRIGEDAWARLDRSFVIRLPGEYDDVRKASPDELAAVQKLEHTLGYNQTEPRPKRVDELMRYALRLSRLGLRRHALRAGIAAGLGSPNEESVAVALADWYGVASGARWVDPWAARLWEAHLAPHMPGTGLPPQQDGVSYAERKQVRDALLVVLRPVARNLPAGQLGDLAGQWRLEWLRADASWKERLRWLKHWLLPRGGHGQSTSIRGTGGLSLVRLENLRALYQLQKAYAARLRLDSNGALVHPLPVGAQFGRRILARSSTSNRPA